MSEEKYCKQSGIIPTKNRLTGAALKLVLGAAVLEGAKAAAEATREARMAVFMVIVL